jgi:hypothetical protein
VTTSVVPARTVPLDRVWRDRLVIALAYVIAWGALVVNRGLYWDDWTLLGRSPASLLEGFSELGLPWAGYLHAAILATPAPGLIGHLIAFFAYLASTLLLHAILGRIPGLSRLDALVAALTFAVLPVNYARIALIDLPYGLSLLAFQAATWLLIRFVEDGGVARRLVSLALFAASFFTASLLILYVVPIAVAGWIAWRSGRRSVPSLVVRHAEFLALPVAYWLLKAALFPASGVYEEYNALSVRGILQVPAGMVAIPWQVLVEPLGRAIVVGGVVGVVVGVLAAIWLLRHGRVVETGAVVPAPVLALIGVGVLALGVFAYLAVGRAPTIWDWSSRHQLLVPLGAGLLAAAAARGLRAGGPVGVALGVGVALLLGISVVADARTLIAYQLDWYKQTALIEAARTTPELQTARHIRVIDEATDLDALRRHYRFYEYNSMFSQVLGDTRRLASSAEGEPGEEEIALFIPRPAYHMEQYIPSPVDLELRITPGDVAAGELEALRLLTLEITGAPSFASEAARLIEVRATPVADAATAPLAGRQGAPAVTTARSAPMTRSWSASVRLDEDGRQKAVSKIRSATAPPRRTASAYSCVWWIGRQIGRASMPASARPPITRSRRAGSGVSRAAV